MGLDFQVIDVKFTEGLDTKTQPKLVIPGKWAQLSNLTLAKDGTPRRRDGTLLLSATNGNGVASHNAELLLIAGNAVSSLPAATLPVPSAVRAVAGELGNVMVNAKDIAFPALGTSVLDQLQDSMDCATGGGYTCYAWVEPNNSIVGCMLVDEATGDVLIRPQRISVAVTICPRVVFSFDSFFIFYNNAPNLYCRVIQTSAPTVLGAAYAILNSASLLYGNFDAIDFGGGGTSGCAMLAYGWTDGATSVKAVQVTQAGGIPALGAAQSIFTEASLPNANITGLGIVAFNATLAAVLTEGTGAGTMSGTSARTIAATGVPVSAAVNLDPLVSATTANNHITGVALFSGTNIAIYYDRQSEIGTASFTAIYTVTVNQALATVSPVAALCPAATFRVNAAEASGPNGPFIFGKAFQIGDLPFLPANIIETYGAVNVNTKNNNEQNQFLVLDGLTGVTVGRALYGNLGNLRSGTKPNVSTPCSTPLMSAGNFGIIVPRRTTLSIFNSVLNSPTGITRLTLTPNSTISPIKKQLGQTTYIAGGSITEYTAGMLEEASFPMFPEGISVVAVAGGGTMAVGSHQVVAIYEWYDNAGNRHQSAPSLAVAATIVNPAADHLSVIVPTLLISQKPGAVIVLYVTQAAGTTFNRAISVQNVTNASTITINVTSTDAVLLANELLYTQPDQAGTTLANIGPGPATALGVHQNRLFVNKSDAPGSYAYSQMYIQSLGLQFADELGGQVDSTAGGIVGFEELDEKVVLFCARKLFAINGTGPNAAGGFNNYSDPQAIPSDVGCVDARSILRMPDGIIFKSSKGWYLLGRGLDVQYIGAGVEAYNANQVSSAVLLEDRQECRFASSSGTTLVYSYLSRQWSTFTIVEYPVADAVWWPTTGSYVHVSLTNQLNTDVAGQSYDQVGQRASVAIPTIARTSWLHLHNLSGFQRVRRCYFTATTPSVPASTMTVDVDYDDNYGAISAGSYGFNIALGTVAFSAGTNLDFRFKLRRMKCKSIAFTFTETAAAYTDVVLTGIQALALEIGTKRGINKLPAAQSVG